MTNTNRRCDAFRSECARLCNITVTIGRYRRSARGRNVAKRNLRATSFFEPAFFVAAIQPARPRRGKRFEQSAPGTRQISRDQREQSRRIRRGARRGSDAAGGARESRAGARRKNATGSSFGAFRKNPDVRACAVRLLARRTRSQIGGGIRSRPHSPRTSAQRTAVHREFLYKIG